MPNCPCSSSGRTIDDDKRSFLPQVPTAVSSSRNAFKHSSREEGTPCLLLRRMHMRRPRGVTFGNSKQLNPQSLPAESNLFLSHTYSSPPTHCTSLPSSSSLVILPFASNLLSTQPPVSRYSAVSPLCDRPHIPTAGCATHTIYPHTQQAGAIESPAFIHFEIGPDKRFFNQNPAHVVVEKYHISSTTHATVCPVSSRDSLRSAGHYRWSG